MISTSYSSLFLDPGSKSLDVPIQYVMEIKHRHQENKSRPWGREETVVASQATEHMWYNGENGKNGEKILNGKRRGGRGRQMW